MHIPQKETAPYLLIVSSDKEQSAASKKKSIFYRDLGSLSSVWRRKYMHLILASILTNMH